MDDVTVSAGSEFNPIYEETFDNSHELYKQMRHECPVAHSTAFGGFWALFKFGDVVGVIEDSATFITSEKNVVPPATRNQGRRPPLHFDPPEHAMFRRPINLVFSTGRMTALTGRVRELADGLLDRLVAQGEFDYTKDFAEYFAAGCFGLILNLPPATMRRAREVQVHTFAHRDDLQAPARGRQASARSRGHRHRLRALGNPLHPRSHRGLPARRGTRSDRCGR